MSRFWFMNILHIAYSLSESSAATRLAYAQDSSGDKVYFLLGQSSSFPFVKQRQLLSRIYFLLSFVSRVIYKIIKIFSNIEKDEVFSFEIFDFYNPFFVKKLVKQYNIDVIHFHWCGAGFFSLQSINNLKDYKIVITFHDYHLATGGCHIPMGCKEFASCERCPLLPKDKFLTSFFRQLIRNRKKLFYELIKNKNVRFISPSYYTHNFLSNQIQEKKLFLLANTIGDRYFDISLEYLKDNFMSKISDNSNLLFIGVKKSTRDNKGYLLMSKLVETSIKEHWPVHINFVACDTPEVIKSAQFRNYSTYDYLDDISLIQLYSSVDVCVLPSKYETFSQVCLESIACCTPVVAFDRTGPYNILSKEFPFFLVPSFDEKLFITKIFDLLFYKRANFLLIFEKKEKICKKYAPSSIALSHSIVYNSFENTNNES